MPPGDDPAHLEELKARLDDLERRLVALEQSSRWLPPVPQTPQTNLQAGLAAGEAVAAPPQSNVFSIFGRVVLGIAGAYLLRALAESHTIPQAIVVVIAVVYAAGWLVWAARARAISWLACYSYAITSALILSPLLWEVTARFGILQPPATAAILAAFALLAMVLAWRSDVSPVVWVGMLTTIVTAFILLVAARDPVSFTSAILFTALLAEFAGCRGRWPGLRFVVALAADFAILIMVVILGDAQSIPQEYHPASASLMIVLVAALFFVYAAALAFRSIGLQWKVAGLEVAQFSAAVLLACWAILRITNGAGLFALGVGCIVAGAACYVAAFGLRSRLRELRNFIFYAVWAALFLLAGNFFAVPGSALVICLCLAAAVATGLGVRARNPVLDLHGVVYLAGAIFASGLLGYAGRALAGTFPSPPGALTFLAAVTALLCAAVISRYPGEHSGERVLRLLPAIFTVFALAALAVAALVRLTAAGAVPALPQLAVIRSVVICAVALLLAFVGARWKRTELVWLAYAAAVLGILKLPFEDFRIGSTLSLTASLLFFGAVLVLIPRVVRAGRRHS